jgi:hypothetical protein
MPENHGNAPDFVDITTGSDSGTRSHMLLVLAARASNRGQMPMA